MVSKIASRNLETKIRLLISRGKLSDALKLIKSNLTINPYNSELWFLRGVIAIKNNRHKLADEFLNKAIHLAKSNKLNPYEYFKYKGILKMNQHLFEDAMKIFQTIARHNNDVESLVYAGCCGFLLEDISSSKYVSRALSLDRTKTKQMIIDFYNAFFESDPSIGSGVKRLLKKKIEEL